jgi:hypothetical protein
VNSAREIIRELRGSPIARRSKAWRASASTRRPPWD